MISIHKKPKELKYTVLVLLLIVALPLSAQNIKGTAYGALDTIFVAPPTGVREIDRAGILSALDKVEPGGTVKFAAGTYVVGETISVTKSQITLFGHPEGTMLRGCDPAKFEDKDFAVAGCNGFNLTAGQQAVRDLIFEYTWHALILGGQPCEAGDCPPGTLPVKERTGGYLIEGNTFRVSQNGIRVVGQWKDPAVIRNNNFINTYHAVVVNGMTAHVTDNNISVPEPGLIPNTYHPGLALMIGGWEEKGAPLCDRNIIAGNKIKGHPDAIAIIVFEGGNCQQNIIRDNTIEMSRVPFDSRSTAVYTPNTADSTVSGIPIAFLNDIFGHGTITNNLTENNNIIGAEGLAIEIIGASDNQILNNTITKVTSRSHFPGNTLYPKAPDWSEANGSGIWISPESNGNEIKGNIFEDIASYNVFIEGDNNSLEIGEAGDLIRDMGTGNQISEKHNRADRVYESKFVDTRGIRLQYMDFGGEGLPVIFIQDYHDYFSIEEEEPQHAAWLSRFADKYRVLAPVRRGWGKSDDPGYGYDVATQAEDLLGLMDALEIDRAVLVGRIPANQDMTWIAEHHPKRVAGLVYIGNPRIFTYPNDTDVKAFNENYARGVCDTKTDEAEKWEQRTGARQAWRPHFFSDPEASIDIPALRFYNPAWEERSLNLRRLEPERIKELALSDHCGDEQAQKYFSELADDEERLQKLRRVFTETDPSRKLNETMERSFGSSINTVVEEGLLGLDAIYNFHFPHMRKFLQRIEASENKRKE